MAHSVFLIINNIVLFLNKSTGLPGYIIVIFNALLLALIVVFVRKEVYSPYFNPNIRWWEQATRFYYDNMRIIVKVFEKDTKLFEATTFDVSETGAFIATDYSVNTGDKFSLEIHLSNESILYAKTTANKDDLICISGSLYTIGEARSLLNKSKKKIIEN